MPYKDPIKKKEYAKKYNSQSHIKEQKRLSRRERYLKNWEQERTRGRQYYQEKRDWILAKNRKYIRENPDKRKNTMLKYEYGITLDDYNKMFNAQGGKCAICQRHQNELKKTLCVDHDHKTGKVRELLCMTCNTDLASVENRLEEMMKYLNKHRKDVN
ncbi:endonuclease VII domain-containing protein [Patescibacteria group bacterium]|nr:endonuclease VII domain-containing protein [Patescibacteria group bacterium]